ncbi:hypothetical protein [Allosphingosinicella sp.]|uniref:hypothetical protein n=1 Tax=Allosphingosinicella sp. TaxID=2823234 RepID=UPI002FC0FE46
MRITLVEIETQNDRAIARINKLMVGYPALRQDSRQRFASIGNNRLRTIWLHTNRLESGQFVCLYRLIVI